MSMESVTPVISGFREACFVLTDIEHSASFYTEVMGWHLVSETPEFHCDRAFNRLWQLDDDCQQRSALLRQPGSQRGDIRLYQFKGIAQDYIRANNQIWDTGGIFDVNSRVENLKELAKALHGYQVFGVSDPCDMQFGPYKVQEWLAKFADGITFALIERIEPPLSLALNGARMSALLNASLIVKNHQDEFDFFVDVLGFQPLIDQGNIFASNSPDDTGSQNESANVFGLPHNLLINTEHRLSLLSSDGSRDGTVEIASFVDLHGRDMSTKAKLGNIGINTLRFPVKTHQDFIALKQRLKENNIVFRCEQELLMAGIGKAQVLMLQTPGGSNLEFYQII